MQVAEQHDLAFLHEPLDQVLGREYSGVQPARWLHPLSVQIHPGQVAPVRAVHDPVDVEHGHHFEDEVLPQDFGLNRGPGQVVDDAQQHLAGERLPRVHPRTDDDPSFFVDLVAQFALVPIVIFHTEISNSEVITWITSNSLAQQLAPDQLGAFLVALEHVEPLGAVGERVGVGVAELNGVVVEVELDREAQGLLLTTGPPFDVVLLLADVVAGSPPSPQLGLVLQDVFILVVSLPFVDVVLQSLF